MKLLLFKAVTGFAMLLSFSVAQAAITHYENANTNSLVYGSYDFDDVLNTFTNIALKANFSMLQGPTSVNIDPDTLRSTIITNGSRSDTYYQFSSGSILFAAFPATLVLSTFERWEIIKGGEVIDYVSGLTPPDYTAELIYFTAKPGSVSTVPEPDVLSLLLFAPIITLFRRKS